MRLAFRSRGLLMRCAQGKSAAWDSIQLSK